ncbi:MAG: ketoacyl-ACP synthase III [Cyclobacteriaceae bacterium]|nr:ketoacyl-ACP synthase III [Cyclobacteriaceae bacterium]
MGSIVPGITAVGAYLPDYILTNQELEKMVDTDDEWITTRTGIKERRILKGEKQGTSVMAVKALEQLLEKSGTDPKDLDAVILATITPDYFFPTTANLVATEVGAVNAFGFDMLAACSGFIFALETGANYIRSGNYKKIAVIGADKMSSIVNYKDRNSCILFGDGAAGVMLEPNDEGLGIYDAIMRSDSVGKELIYLKGGGSVNPPTHETIDAGLHQFFQDGKSVFRYAVTSMAGVAAEIMKKNNLKGEDIAYLVPHQANKRIIDATAKRMGVGPEKVMLNIQYYGNTTAATIPLCLYDYEDKLKKGDNLILAAFGGGFTWGSMYLKWAY